MKRLKMIDKVIDWSDVTPTHCCDRFSIRASDLGLGPGEWPRFLKTTMGNALAFLRVAPLDEGFLYYQGGGSLSLVVRNT
jgi:hypothetical protein